MDVDLDYQDFETELATLPGEHEAPSGRLLLAWSGTEPVGCVALRPLESGSCEIKRLYVRPQSRGKELGRHVVERVCQEAREAGYSRIDLDTLASMKAAIKPYDALGFKPVGPDRTPNPEVSQHVAGACSFWTRAAPEAKDPRQEAQANYSDNA